MKHKMRVNIPMCLAGVLFCLTLISIHFTSGLYAKYITKTGSEDSARVAQFDVTEECSLLSKDVVFEIRPGTSEYQIAVNNKSEVAIDYKVSIINTSKTMPLSFQIGDSAAEEDQVQVSQQMKANDSAIYIVKILWDAEGALEYMGMVDLIQIHVEAVQRD